MRELFEDLLGPEAVDVLSDALQRRPDVMSTGEIEAIQRFTAGHPLTEMDKLSLNDVVMALADDFGSRRRAQELHRLLHQPAPPGQEEDDWIPDEMPSEPTVGPDGTIGPSLEEFLADLGDPEDPDGDVDDEMPDEDELDDLF